MGGKSGGTEQVGEFPPTGILGGLAHHVVAQYKAQHPDPAPVYEMPDISSVPTFADTETKSSDTPVRSDPLPTGPGTGTGTGGTGTGTAGDVAAQSLSAPSYWFNQPVSTLAPTPIKSKSKMKTTTGSV